MTITEKHELQGKIMAHNVMADQRFARNTDLLTARKLCAFWMKQARSLTDSRLREIAAAL